VHDRQSIRCLDRSLFWRCCGAMLLAGILMGAAAVSARASDTKKVDKPTAPAQALVDPTCKTPNDASDKIQIQTSPADPGTGSRAEEEGNAAAGDSMRIKTDLADKPQSDEESAQEPTKTGDASTPAAKEGKSAAGPQQCERPAPKHDLTLPSSGKDGSPE